MVKNKLITLIGSLAILTSPAISQEIYDENGIVLSEYKILSEREQADLVDTHLENKDIQFWIDTDDGKLTRFYDVNHKTSLDDLLIINEDNITEYPVWDRDIILEGSPIYFGVDLLIKPGVVVYFGYDFLIEEYDQNEHSADLTVVSNLNFIGTYDNRISFLSIAYHPEAETYFERVGHELNVRYEEAARISIIFCDEDERFANINYCYFEGFNHGGVSVISESKYDSDVEIKYNIFKARFDIHSDKNNYTAADISDNFFYDAKTTTELLEVYGTDDSDDIVFYNNIIGPGEPDSIYHHRPTDTWIGIIGFTYGSTALFKDNVILLGDQTPEDYIDFIVHGTYDPNFPGVFPGVDRKYIEDNTFVEY